MPFVNVTRAAFRTALRNRLGPQTSSAPYWSDTELHAAIHEALRLWNLLTGYWTDRTVVSAEGQQTFVTLPANVIAPTHAFWQGAQLSQASLFELDQAVPTWQSAAAGIPHTWVPIAANLFALYPKPATTSTSLLLDGVRVTPLLAADSDSLTLSAPFYEVLLNYARHLALFKLGGSEFAESQGARKALWEAAGAQNQHLKSTALYRKVLGLPGDSVQRPLTAGEVKVGVRA